MDVHKNMLLGIFNIPRLKVDYQKLINSFAFPQYAVWVIKPAFWRKEVSQVNIKQSTHNTPSNTQTKHTDGQSLLPFHVPKDMDKCTF